jgi:hypothetical protein
MAILICGQCGTQVSVPDSVPVGTVLCPHCHATLFSTASTSAGDGGFRCPFCQTDAPPELCSKVAAEGWVCFFVLLLFCFPLCLLGLLVREEYRACSACGVKLG